MLRRGFIAILAALLCLTGTPLLAATPREILVDAAFNTHDRALALTKIADAERRAAVGDGRDANFDRAMALGYHAKLTRNRQEAISARKAFERMAAANPQDADAAAAIGTWHLDSVIDLGGLIAGMAIGAKKAPGLKMMDRAVTLGGNRAMYSGLTSLLRLSLDPDDPRGRKLAEATVGASVTQPIDRIMQRNAMAIVASLKSGNSAATQKLARKLLPFGTLNR